MGFHLKTCHFCYYRHRCPYPHKWEGCKHWRLGKCLLCKGIDSSDQEWREHGCESECFGGCRKHFKRNWKATFKWWFKREVDWEKY